MDVGRQLRERGVVLVPGVVPPALCAAAAEAICSFLGVDLADRSTWRETGEPVNGIVPIHQHPALWEIRQHPPLYEVFAELLGRRDLWVTMDRASFKPPRVQAPAGPSWIHLDADPEDAGRVPFQGLVYLNDTAEDQAAFECVPSLYRDIEDGPVEVRRGPVAIHGRELVRVPGAAGSLVVWSSRLPHGSAHNRSGAPRLAAYVTMVPAGDAAEAAERVQLWRAGRAPPWWRDIPGQLDPEPWGPAPLTAHGERLLGLRRW